MSRFSAALRWLWSSPSTTTGASPRTTVSRHEYSSILITPSSSAYLYHRHKVRRKAHLLHTLSPYRWRQERHDLSPVENVTHPYAFAAQGVPCNLGLVLCPARPPLRRGELGKEGFRGVPIRQCLNETMPLAHPVVAVALTTCFVP